MAVGVDGFDRAAMVPRYEFDPTPKSLDDDRRHRKIGKDTRRHRELSLGVFAACGVAFPFYS
jgi:hypothetical protein